MTEAEWYEACARAREAQLRGEDVSVEIQRLVEAAADLDVRPEPLAHMLHAPPMSSA